MSDSVAFAELVDLSFDVKGKQEDNKFLEFIRVGVEEDLTVDEAFEKVVGFSSCELRKRYVKSKAESGKVVNLWPESFVKRRINANQD